MFITGASGAGKTHLATALEQKLDLQFFHIAYFDTIGVPSVHEMIQQFGFCEKWQEMATYKWIAKLSTIKKPVIILEGQFNPQFAIDACKENNITNFILFNIHARRHIREKRLLEQRMQPELVNEDMNNWAEFLRCKTLELNGIVIDTSSSNLDKNAKEIIILIQNKIKILGMKLNVPTN